MKFELVFSVTFEDVQVSRWVFLLNILYAVGQQVKID